MEMLNGGKKKKYHNFMDVILEERYIKQCIEIFGDEIYTDIYNKYNRTSNNSELL